MAWPRLVFGETSRGRELMALVEGLQAECDRKDRRIAADAKVHDASLAALREQFEKVIVERDEARRERDQHASRLEALEAERHESELDWVHARQEHYESRRKLRTLARAVVNDLREMAANIEVDHLKNESPEDRPATDDGTEGAGTEPE